MLRRSLILAGGGVRLAYHAGVLQALEEAGLVFNHVDGTSGGIFGTAMVASGIGPDEAATRWRKLKLRGFLGAIPTPGKGLGIKVGKGADGIRQAIFPALGIDAARIRALQDFDASFNVCNYSRKCVESIPHHAVTTDHLIAGMSLPMFMPAIAIGDDWYTDAVWIKDCNMLEALRRGAEEIWLVWCIGNTPVYPKGTFHEYVAMIEISANAGVQRELEAIHQENERRLQEGKTPVKIHLIKPEFPLPLDPDFFLGKINADTLISLGYADAYRSIGAADFNLDAAATATQMHPCKALFHFRTQFRGKIFWDGREQVVELRLGLFFYDTTEGVVLRCAATIEAEDGKSICAFNPQLERTEKGRLEARFSIAQSNGTCHFSVSMLITGWWGLRLGLDNQEAGIIITDAAGQSLNYIFSQPAGIRIRNAFHLSIIGAQTPAQKRQSRAAILHFLLQ